MRTVAVDEPGNVVEFERSRDEPDPLARAHLCAVSIDQQSATNEGLRADHCFDDPSRFVAALLVFAAGYGSPDAPLRTP